MFKYDQFFCNIKVCTIMSDPQKSYKDLFSLEELCNMINLAGLNLLCNLAGWALGKGLADHHYQKLLSQSKIAYRVGIKQN